MMTKNSNSTNTSGKPPAASAPVGSKLDRLLAELAHDDGATIDQLATATGWQKHSVRGAMAGTLKRKGHHIASTKSNGVRRYRLVSVG
jgi:hypothetical protein